jgi:formylglycine-generating enzyme required for sulfatase activity
MEQQGRRGDDGTRGRSLVEAVTLWRVTAVLAALLAGAGTSVSERAVSTMTTMASVDGGRYVPLYGNGVPVAVAPFRIDAYAVTNAQFLEFVTAEPRWRRSEVPEIFAGEGYLRHWAGDLELGSGPDAPRPDAPVTNVSWFAARRYCDWRGRRLPTLDEWERVAMASEDAPDGTGEPDFNQRLLDWYAKPRPHPLPAVGSTFRNFWGVYDIHGLVWEWVEDFNSVFVTGESRADGSVDRQLYCAGAGAGASDARNYAAFLRYAMRSSVEASYAVGNLGFRCAGDAS